jgi:peroxiredoxin
MNRRRALLIGALGGLLPLAAAARDGAPAQVGKPAPRFRVRDSDNRERQLSEFAGSAVVLEWTSPSCPFVRAQYDSGVMQELQRMAAKQSVAWLSVLSTHPSRRDYLAPDKAASFHRARGASTALLLDTEGTMGRAYGAVVTPHMFIVGADGTLVYAGGTGDKPTMDASEVRASRSYIRAALEDLAAGRRIATPTSRPFGCTIAYRG